MPVATFERWYWFLKATATAIANSESLRARTLHRPWGLQPQASRFRRLAGLRICGTVHLDSNLRCPVARLGHRTNSGATWYYWADRDLSGPPIFSPEDPCAASAKRESHSGRAARKLSRKDFFSTQVRCSWGKRISL